MSAGTVITGGWFSRTITLKVDVELLPAASFAVQFTGVVPTGKFVPEAGEQTRLVTPTASVAVGFVYVTVVPPALPVDALTSACGAITGAVVSCTVTWNDA